METHPPSRRDHRTLRRGVGVYLDGEADPALAMEVRRHLERCWSCSEDAEWLVIVKAALTRIGRRRPPELAIAHLERFVESMLSRR